MSKIKTMAIIAGVGVAVLLFVILVGSTVTTPASTKQQAAESTNEQSVAHGQPAVIRIPEDYSTVVSKDFKFSFAYPAPWASAVGITSGATVNINSAPKSEPTYFLGYALGGSVLNGGLIAYVDKQDAFTLDVRPQGATVAPVKLGDSYGWKVIKAGSADPTLKIGDSYDIKSAKYQPGVPVYNFNTNAKDVVKTRWVIQSGDYFIAVALPSMSRADGSAPSASDLAQYAAISNNIAETLRPTD